MRVVGVDGCKSGWVAVILDDGQVERAALAPDLRAALALAPDAAFFAVDVPIGSEPDRFRQVDDAARRFVGPRWASVFAVPPVETFGFSTYPEAVARCRALTGKSPSKQVWELREKILHAAKVARDEPRVIEVHPEVSFCELAGRHMLHSKKTWAGQAARRAALASVGIVLDDDLGEAGTAAPDDVLDAAVAAWSAHRHATGSSKCLAPKLSDSHGRFVTIWY